VLQLRVHHFITYLNSPWSAANETVYKRMHFLLFTGSGGSNAARIASSKTFFNPFCEQKYTTNTILKK
jgi:hypothetical protein